MSDEVADFPFAEDPDLGVFVCSKVLVEGHPILHVSHDADGDWQFTCGGDHAEESGDEAKLVCLKHILAREPTIAELADLCPAWWAERDDAQGSWERFDGMEDIVRDNVEEYGLHVMSVSADDVGPSFAYTIGIAHSLIGPEVICCGLPPKSAHSVLNHVANLIREGVTIQDGEMRTDVLDGYSCRFESVSEAAKREYFGYANWFYKALDYPAMQLVYPDREGVFPDEPNASAEFKRDQPLLSNR